VCLWLSTASVYNTKQNSSDNVPSYLQTNIIAQMLSIRGEGGGEMAMAVAQSSSGFVTICYILPVLWMMSRLHNGQELATQNAYTQSDSPGGSIRLWVESDSMIALLEQAFYKSGATFSKVPRKILRKLLILLLLLLLLLHSFLLLHWIELIGLLAQCSTVALHPWMTLLLVYRSLLR